MGFLTDNASGETAVLVTFLRNQFAQVRSAAYGLTDEQIVSRPTVSAFSIGSLLRHVGIVAKEYGAGIAAAPASADSYQSGEPEEPAGLTAEQLLEEFDARVASLNAVLDALPPLETPVPVPAAPWFPDDLKTWEVRWVLAHMCTEIARHAGHADIIRESIDGRGSYELNDLADGIERHEGAAAHWA